MVIFALCLVCEHYKGIDDNTKAILCDGFPDGVPPKFYGTEQGECNKGISFVCANGKEKEYEEMKKCM